MPHKVQILHAAAQTPLGNLHDLWQLWLNGNPPSPPTHPDNWHALTTPLAKQISESLTPADRQSTGLILATTKANIADQTHWMRNAQNAKLPTLASEAALLASAANIHGPTHAVSTACTSGLTALIDASLTLLNHDASHMIALAADQATDFVTDGFNALRALSPTQTCRPFDKSRDGLTLGSAAAAALLTLSPTHQVTQSPTISGFGLSNDATHMTAPDPQANGLIRAIHQALHMAKLNPEDIDVLLAHATATKYNDAMEAAAIQKIFLTQNRKGPAVTALKPLLGHTLGASGLLETTLALNILQFQLIPPIFNLIAPEFPQIDLVFTTRKAKIRHLLKTASGFGGFNAALILSLPA